MNPKHPAEILADAVELPEEERDAFLVRACAGDAALLAEVRSLLDAHRRADDLLPSGFLHEFAPWIERSGVLSKELLQREIGRRIGAYTLRRVLGAGGMGAVFLAERSDDEFAKQVAIKLVRPSTWSDEVLRRFLNERQVLANLEHPYIARLLDGGATEDAFPYIVMEYVDGLPIDRYADEHRLDVRARLLLFQKVCEAVGFAHRNAIVHRDLKPGNILVDARGEPKLLDFGIAKILDAAVAGEETAMTGTAMRLLTPDYASPEQVRGGTITTATDVYSLGVLLFELLTGRRPYHVRSRSPLDVEKAICEAEPPRPSAVVALPSPSGLADAQVEELRAAAIARRTQPDQLRRQLSGDLDNIVLLALRKEPERRYPSVESFADDIQRHLEGFPVRARQDTWGYRTAKFVRRNRLAVGTATTIFALVVAFTITFAFQARRLAHERDRARHEAETAGRVSLFLTDLFKMPEPQQARGETITAREILDMGTEKIQKGLETEPAVRAELLRTMGNTYWSLGVYAPACSLLAQAVDLQTELYGPTDNEHLAQTLTNLAIAYRGAGQTKESRALYERALQIRTASLPADHPDMALLHGNYGTVLFDVGEYAGAREQFESAIRIWEKLGGHTKEIVPPLRSLVHVELQERRFDEALKDAHRALQLSEEDLGEDHPETILSLSTLGIVSAAAGHPDSAVVVLEKALPLAEKVFGPTHTNTAQVVNALAAAYQTSGDLPHARELFTRALDLRRASLGPTHASLANPIYRLASIEADLGEERAALGHFREAASVLEAAAGPDHPNLPYILVQHAKYLVKLGRYEEAELLFNRAGGIWEKKMGPTHPLLVQVLLARGAMERSRHQLPAADAQYARALKICADSLASDHADAIRTRKEYAALLREMGQESRAAALEK